MKKIILEKVINLVREQLATSAPTNNVGSGNIAGTVEAGDDPPVSKKKQKKQYWSGGRGARRQWMLKNASK
jgi:hypothetical protein